MSNTIHADSKLVIFSLSDDYSFGIIQSGLHWEWIKARGGTQTTRFTYTSDTVFDTFPWPQFSEPRSRLVKEAQTASRGKDQSLVTSAATMEKIRAVAESSRALRALRRETMEANGWSLRDLYRSLETPGDKRLRDGHAALDTAVRRAYGMMPEEDILAFLLKLNLELADKEAEGEFITPPGLPAFVPHPASLVSEDCVNVERQT